MNQALFALWKYDAFPYVLGGEITRFCEKDWPGKDYVETKNYGPGCYFKPVKIVPLKVGKELLAKYEALAAERDEELKAVYAKFEKKLTELNK
jgi:hypothetical protein